MENKAGLLKAIGEKKAKVCVLGLGYVGLPLALRFAEVGFPVLGIDVDRNKVESIKKGISYIRGVEFKANSSPAIAASTDFSLLRDAEAAIICVPTPLSKTRDPDLSLVLEAARTISENLHPGQLIVLESTTYPGTTRELLLPLLEEKGLRIGKDFFLAYSPERVDPGNDSFTFSNTPKIIAGITPNCLELAQALYSQIAGKVVPVQSTDTAEMVKLLENTFRSINIALVNEFAIMCDRLGLDVWEVIGAAATKPFGFMPFYPGPGLGGHCIPVDPHYLTWRARMNGFEPRLIESATQINSQMPSFVISRVADALNERQKSLKGSKILGLGLAYKKDTTDTRESPAIEVLQGLREKGAQVYYSDPYVRQIEISGTVLVSLDLTPSNLQSMDCAVLLTDHSAFDYELIATHSPLIIDTRNALKEFSGSEIARL